jgi:DNA/RNA endonuclease YhcR with UshA esterase domain
VGKDLVGQRIAVEGVVEKLKIFKPGTSFFLKDDSGSVQVFVRTEVRKKIPNLKQTLYDGSRLRIAGKVGTYRGKVQIEPQDPVDIEVK